MRRRDILKALGFGTATLGTGGYIAYNAVSEEPSCFEELEEEKFQELLETSEENPEYTEEYDITNTGKIGQTDWEIYNAYLESEYHPELSMYCEINKQK